MIGCRLLLKAGPTFRPASTLTLTNHRLYLQNCSSVPTSHLHLSASKVGLHCPRNDSLDAEFSNDAQELKKSGRNPEEFQNDKESLTVISWNVNGIGPGSDENLSGRTREISKLIQEKVPDVVCLQEVVDQSARIFESELGQSYSTGFFPQNSAKYFTAMLFRKETVDISTHEVQKFENSRQGRSLEIAVLNRKHDQRSFACMNTHLESLGPSSARRVEQLKIALSRLAEFTEEGIPAALIGDLNIREKEVKGMGGWPHPLADFWEEIGRPADTQFPFDTRKNTDLAKFYNGWVRARYDRIIYGKLNGFEAGHLSFVGDRRNEIVGKFLSDHFALLAKFILRSKQGTE